LAGNYRLKFHLFTNEILEYFQNIYIMPCSRSGRPGATWLAGPVTCTGRYEPPVSMLGSHFLQCKIAPRCRNSEMHAQAHPASPKPRQCCLPHAPAPEPPSTAMANPPASPTSTPTIPMPSPVTMPASLQAKGEHVVDQGAREGASQQLSQGPGALAAPRSPPPPPPRAGRRGAAGCGGRAGGGVWDGGGAGTSRHACAVPPPQMLPLNSQAPCAQPVQLPSQRDFYARPHAHISREARSTYLFKGPVAHALPPTPKAHVLPQAGAEATEVRVFRMPPGGACFSTGAEAHVFRGPRVKTRMRSPGEIAPTGFAKRQGRFHSSRACLPPGGGPWAIAPPPGLEDVPGVGMRLKRAWRITDNAHR
jgi:hypothetical protein